MERRKEKILLSTQFFSPTKILLLTNIFINLIKPTSSTSLCHGRRGWWWSLSKLSPPLFVTSNLMWQLLSSPSLHRLNYPTSLHFCNSTILLSMVQTVYNLTDLMSKFFFQFQLGFSNQGPFVSVNKWSGVHTLQVLLALSRYNAEQIAGQHNLLPNSKFGVRVKYLNTWHMQLKGTEKILAELSGWRKAGWECWQQRRHGLNWSPFLSLAHFLATGIHNKEGRRLKSGVLLSSLLLSSSSLPCLPQFQTCFPRPPSPFLSPTFLSLSLSLPLVLFSTLTSSCVLPQRPI